MTNLTSRIASIQRIEKELHATTNQIALSLSLFILVQGNAPLLWSSISEIKGRKFVYVLAIFIFILGSAIGGISNNISLLIFMRMFQAAGSSAVLALGAGTLADIYAPHERGTMMGIYYAAPLLGPSVGPLIGGVLTQVFTWRATFYFLAAIGAIVFLSIVFFFKDTFRRERSLTYQSAKRHAIRRLEEKRQKREEKEKRIAERKGEEDKLEKGGAQSQMKEVTNTRDESTVKVTLIDLNPLTPIWSVLRRKNNLTILIPSAILFAVQYSVCFTTARTFAASPYNYDPLKIGLVLLSFGLGNVLGSVLGGKWSDLKLHELKTMNGGKGWAEMRLESTKLVMILLPPAILAFGWTCQEHTHIVGPVITLFISGFSVLFIYSSTLAYIVDANSGRSTTAVASNSSFRGLSGFVASEIAAPLQDSLGDGGLYSIWAGLLVITELMILLVIWKGKTWREEAEKHEKFLGGLGVDSNEGTRQVSSGSTTPALDGVAAPIRRNVTYVQQLESRFSTPCRHEGLLISLIGLLQPYDCVLVKQLYDIKRALSGDRISPGTSPFYLPKKPKHPPLPAFSSCPRIL
ncbi:hypothetical protein FRB91_006547 [Serendipita sp. 411]|nr:hypothetical protein FRB91_006547 [Serendipita sp. 411]